MTLQEHYHEQFSEGYMQGLKNGMEQGIERGMEQGSLQTIIRFVRDGDISMEQGAEEAGLSLKEFQKLMSESEKNTN